MMEQTQPVRPMTEEEIKFEKMTKQIEKLEKIVGALAVTNFLTQHEDGDEEVRDKSVEVVNKHAYQFKQDWKAEKQIAELEEQKRQLDDKINGIKWGTLTYKTSERYGLGFDIKTQTFTNAKMNTAIALDKALNSTVDIQQERMNAFNASAARAEAVAVFKGSK